MSKQSNMFMIDNCIWNLYYKNNKSYWNKVLTKFITHKNINIYILLRKWDAPKWNTMVPKYLTK